VFWPQFDTDLFTAINGYRNHWLDTLLWHASQWEYWLPLFVLFIYLLYKNNTVTQFTRILIIIVVCIGASDFVASGVLKPLFERLRPSHNYNLKAITLHNYIGGMYGFASSHAANTAAFFTLVFLLLRKYTSFLCLCILYPIITGYSRVYLGVHYPLDVLVGWCIGIVITYVVVKIAIVKSFVINA
jgi:undecaprenyl-diphosphatase